MKNRPARIASAAVTLVFALLSFPGFTDEAVVARKQAGFEKVVRTAAGTLCAADRELGFLISTDNGRTWRQRNRGLPEHKVYPFTDNRPVPLTSIGTDPVRQSRVAVTTSSGIFISEDLGRSWREVPAGPPIKDSAFFTSVSLSPFSRERLILGTSFSGVYETADSGETWNSLEALTGPLYRGAGFYEEISTISYDVADGKTVYLEAGFGGGLYRGGLEDGTLTVLPEPAYTANERTLQLVPQESGLNILTNEHSWSYRPEAGVWISRRGGLPAGREPISKEKQARLAAASGKYGIYLKSWNSSGESLEQHLSFLKEHGLNSLVIDMKDDNGRITYDTELDLPRQIGAVSEHIKLEELVEAADKAGIYIIGRIVCFQDPKLFAFRNGAYAVWDGQKDEPWANKLPIKDEETGETTWIQREYWVDSFSEFAWDYLISIAEELERRGIDEIQFDYIRFPSDGDLSHAVYRHRKPGMSKIDGLESFLMAARERIQLPISTDLYGFNSWYRMGNWIGQNIEMVSRYVDVICPMYYPSHFPRDFLKSSPYLERAEYIYRHGSDRAAEIAGGRSIIRPYVQAFLIGGELSFEEPTYTDYLIRQIRGAGKGRASGFTLWNNSNRYYMVTVPLNGYTGTTSKEEASLLN